MSSGVQSSETVQKERSLWARIVDWVILEGNRRLLAFGIVNLEGLEDAFESIAVVRQFYKTVALQQDLTELSRLLVYVSADVYPSSVPEGTSSSECWHSGQKSISLAM